MEDILAIILIFGGGAAFLFSVSPIGKAIAARIQAKAGPLPEGLAELGERQDAILDELGALRRELTEVQERMDFTERMLARERSTGRLAPGQSEGVVEE
jgi:hypothetical protein